MTTSEPLLVAQNQSAYPKPSIAWYTTGLLAFLYWLSILDRFIISLLVDPIKRDLGLSDIQFGLLHGLAFAITFSLFGLVAGSLADRVNRRWIIYTCVSIWSLATAACGLAQQFWHLLIARVCVGVGEAGLNPCAASMISDLFPRSRLTTAMAVYTIGATIGSGCAYLLGGLIVSLVSDRAGLTLPVIGVVHPWQAVFVVVGLPGLLLALLIFTTPEPVRFGRNPGLDDKGPTLGFMSGYRVLLKFICQQRFFIFHYIGFGLTGLVASGAAAWWPAHMGRTFGWGAGQIGLSLGLTLIVSSVIGKLVCGLSADWLYRKGYRDAQFRWAFAALLIATPFGVIATTSSNPVVFLSCLGVFLGFVAPMPACANAALNLATPNELRGAGIAFYSAIGGIIGISVGPLLVAAISDLVFGGDAIGYGLAVTFAICCPMAALILCVGRHAMRKAVEQQEA